MAEKRVRLDPEDKTYLYLVYDTPEQPDTRPPRIFTDDYYNGNVNPDTGLPTVYVPGEVVPDWAVQPDDRAALGLPALE